LTIEIDLTEYLAGTHDVDGGIRSVRPCHRDFGTAAEQHEEFRCRLAFLDDRLSCFVLSGVREPAQVCEFVLRESLEHPDSAQSLDQRGSHDIRVAGVKQFTADQ
jgi:hypothetical protein